MFITDKFNISTVKSVILIRTTVKTSAWREKYALTSVKKEKTLADAHLRLIKKYISSGSSLKNVKSDRFLTFSSTCERYFSHLQPRFRHVGFFRLSRWKIQEDPRRSSEPVPTRIEDDFRRDFHIFLTTKYCYYFYYIIFNNIMRIDPVQVKRRVRV